jgi:alpha-amylase/alpha-mannosidase (GH57 family)
VAEPLSVALVWHMHQPYYREDAEGRFLLPWARRRASKDYLRMIETAMRFPALRINMNFVPTLLEQLELYAQPGVRDAHRELCLRPTAELSEDERVFLAGFARSTDHPRRVAVFAPYYRLLEELPRDGSAPDDGMARDLQVWSELIWIDPAAIRADPALTALVRSGRGFDEEVKRIVDERLMARVRAVLPALRQAVAAGVVEPMTSPFAHPILPLLIDQESARVARPELALPAPHLRLRAPGDAAAQIERGLATFERLCAVRPRGMWPPECAVSPSAASLMATAGVRFSLSDEGVLARSLAAPVRGDAAAAARLYTPCREAGGLRMVFRDAVLSDLIGFEYPSRDPGDAVQDLTRRLEEIAAARPAGQPWLVVIALDGENCWDHYQENGTPFLEHLYAALTTHPSLHCEHVGAFLDRHAGSLQPLDMLWSGSWIDADFATWIGEPAHTRAWTLLAHARGALEAAGGPAANPAAYRQLLIAEGSDWFWWFSTRHQSGIDAAWDALYRTHLRRLHELCGSPPPADLDQPVLARPQRAAEAPPLRAIAPASGDDVEWLAGGIAAVTSPFAAMAPPPVGGARVNYGSSRSHLHVRVEGDRGPRAAALEVGGVRTELAPGQAAFAVPLPHGPPVEFTLALRDSGGRELRVPSTGALTVPRFGHPTVVVVAVECAPIATVGGLAAAVRTTVDALLEGGRHCVVVLPHHRGLDDAAPLIRVPALGVPLQAPFDRAQVRQGIIDRGATLLTIAHPVFDRDDVYGSADDTERYVFFARAAFDLMQAVALGPWVVHGFEWQTAVTLALLATAPAGARTVFSAIGEVRHVAAAALCRAAGLGDAAGDSLDLLELGLSSAAVVQRGPADAAAIEQVYAGIDADAAR